jgi:predicted HAD superfamily Cof-like phosphohydrolase
VKRGGHWAHFGPVTIDDDKPNEWRADYGSRISACSPDWGSNDLHTDLSDALADVVHFIHRCGLDPEELFDHALRSAEGDLEDGPEAAVDTHIKLAHDRMAV